jgi:hypothetical protein
MDIERNRIIDLKHLWLMGTQSPVLPNPILHSCLINFDLHHFTDAADLQGGVVFESQPGLPWFLPVFLCEYRD